MIKKLWLFCFLYSTAALGQKQQHIDSLFKVKDYLLLLQQTVTDKNNAVKQQYGKIDSLLKNGVYYQNLLQVHLAAVVMLTDERERLQQSFRLIIQSAILLKTDIKQQGYKAGKNTNSEIQYMNKNIPPLVHSIYRYCREALNGG